jgi:hypothetical protein
VAAEVSFRKAELAEADAIAGLINRAFAVESFFIDGDRTNPEKVRELLGLPLHNHGYRGALLLGRRASSSVSGLNDSPGERLARSS